MSINSEVVDQLSISCAVASLRVPAAVAVNVSLPENTSGASDEGGTFASSMNDGFVCRTLARHYPDCVFSKLAERAGDSRRLDFLFLLYQDKRKKED
jgi:hypothetical protein